MVCADLRYYYKKLLPAGQAKISERFPLLTRICRYIHRIFNSCKPRAQKFAKPGYAAAIAHEFERGMTCIVNGKKCADFMSLSHALGKEENKKLFFPLIGQSGFAPLVSSWVQEAIANSRAFVPTVQNGYQVAISTSHRSLEIICQSVYSENPVNVSDPHAVHYQDRITYDLSAFDHENRISLSHEPIYTQKI
jgi:hypothetical protein